MEQLKTYFKRPFFRHLLFWIVVFFIYTTSHWEYFDTPSEVFITYFLKVGMQIFAAYISLWFILPRFMEKKNIVEVILSIFIVSFILNSVIDFYNIYFHQYYFPNLYATYLERHGEMSIFERVFDIKVILLKIPLFYFQPAIILVAFQFYQKQQKLLELNEKKKTAELTALKNQLNPHFLFNTLNNLYALSIKKSDETPMVISKLSDILDYILYRCNNKFVALDKEVALLENYLTLEKIRYGKRVEISFEQTIDDYVQIAPLLLLTFVENAFKHGVCQEINQAHIDINLITTEQEIIFEIKNSIPKESIVYKEKKESIGLKNVSKQLELIYPNMHELIIENDKKFYFVQLKITKNDL